MFYYHKGYKRLLINDVCNQGEGGCPVRTFFGQGGFQMWMSALFGAKTLDFLKFMVCLHRQGGGNEVVEPVQTFC